MIFWRPFSLLIKKFGLYEIYFINEIRVYCSVKQPSFLVHYNTNKLDMPGLCQIIRRHNPMKIACISDMHLGAEKRCDGFHHEEDVFLHFLDYLEHHYDLIVLNGDIYDTRKSKAFHIPMDQLMLVKERYKQLSERFSQSNYKQIAGNHDYILKDLGCPTHYSVQDEDGMDYIFTHGHQFDKVETGGKFPIAVTWLVGWLERLGWKNADSYLAWAQGITSSFFQKTNIETLRMGAMEMLAKSNVAAVVMGHTHETPVRMDMGDKIYMNSGSCSKKRLQYVHLDTTEKDFHTKNWCQTNRYGIAIDTSYPALQT
ncbi:MAG TPA: hypothetical protein ENI73_09460 [Spirochaetes bacterium]|nr:hypothetical protein [Spirochaetota bacterium]